jgi:hypothetical protein
MPHVQNHRKDHLETNDKWYWKNKGLNLISLEGKGQKLNQEKSWGTTTTTNPLYLYLDNSL